MLESAKPVETILRKSICTIALVLLLAGTFVCVLANTSWDLNTVTPYAELLVFVPGMLLINASLQIGFLSRMLDATPEPDRLFLVLSILTLFFLIFYLAKRQEQGWRAISKSPKGDDFSVTAR
jgi:hypothetical protein